MSRLLVVFLLFSLFIAAYPSDIAQAQAVTTLQCGSIIGAEFTQKAELHNYTLTVGAGDKFLIRAQPANESSKIVMAIVGPTGLPLISTGNYGYPITLPYLETPLLSALGERQF